MKIPAYAFIRTVQSFAAKRRRQQAGDGSVRMKVIFYRHDEVHPEFLFIR
jgi:hypothetical protein